jgi:hypothetical protein
MTEWVFASSPASKDAHRNLYHFSESSYIIPGKDLIESIITFKEDFSRLHIVSPWMNMVMLALGQAKPQRGDMFLLLRRAGIKAEELVPFRESELGDIFPWLYYGRRFDVLRRICQAAKVNAERYLRNNNVRVHCHLVVEDIPEIIASSL